MVIFVVVIIILLDDDVVDCLSIFNKHVGIVIVVANVERALAAQGQSEQDNG